MLTPAVPDDKNPHADTSAGFSCATRLGLSRQHPPHSFGVGAVFLLEDARAERGLGIVGMDGDAALHDRLAGIDACIDEVNRAARLSHARRKRLPLRVEAQEKRAAATGGR